MVIRIKKRIKKETLYTLFAVLLGCIWGWIWLLPSYYPPNSNPSRATTEFLRGVRLVSPILIAILGSLFWSCRRPIKPLDILLFTVFIFWPAVSLLVTGVTVEEQISTSGPLASSAVVIFLLSLWPIQKLKSLVIGIGLAAFAFIATRTLAHGIEVSTYYLRPRIHLGFDHPLVTSGAIFFAALSYLSITELIKTPWVRLVAFIAGLLIAFHFLSRADSKNMLLFCNVMALLAICRFYVKNRRIWSWSMSLFFPALVIASTYAYLKNLQLVPDQPEQASLQSRIDSIYTTFDIMTGSDGAIFGKKLYNYYTFALTDSAYTTYWIHFGIIGLFFLLLFFWYFGRQLARRPTSTVIEYLAFGGFGGAVLFFLGDAQGLTPANLAVFLTLAVAYRQASWVGSKA